MSTFVQSSCVGRSTSGARQLINMSHSQVDRLGDALRGSKPTVTDLKDLDAFRRTFGPSYDFVMATLRSELGLEPTGRPAKSTSAIREKLVRESIRLSQMQDIAGCRVIVSNIVNQDELLESMKRVFADSEIVDRRIKPSHGYRAVHMVVRHAGKRVEIQIRSRLQHLWAELSERAADVLDPAIKYGGGDKEVRDHIDQIAEVVIKSTPKSS